MPEVSESLGKVVSVLTAISVLASAFCSLTGTPDPATKLGKLYRLLEMLALNIGKAKDKGGKNGW